MSVTRRHVCLVLALSFVSCGSAIAEMGSGVVQDPVTRQYTYNVHKDWQEGIVLDPATRNYIITYKIDEGKFATVVFEPATKIGPSLRSTFDAERGNVIHYRYTVGNGPNSGQGIEMIRMTVSNLSGSPTSIGDWEGHVAPNVKEGGQLVLWSCSRNGDICALAPGRRQGGFVLESGDLAGIRMVQFWGQAVPTRWFGEPDLATPIGNQIWDLTKTNNYVGYLAVVPLIPVASPFNGASALSGVQKHVDTDLVNLGLIDPGFASRLDRWFQAAISAAGLGNLSAVRDDLNELHRLLEREHEGLDRGDEEKGEREQRDRGRSGLIDRLAAKVLTFDLKYVQRRLLSEQGRGR